MTVQREHTQATARIEFLLQERRAALLAGDFAGARRVEGELVDARMEHEWAVDLVRWRAEQKQREQAAARVVPDDAKSLREEREKQERRLAALSAKLPRDRTAVDDEMIGGLPSYIELLRQREQMAERMERR
jgi:hypothetical protein